MVYMVDVIDTEGLVAIAGHKTIINIESGAPQPQSIAIDTAKSPVA